ncbi:MAG: hypothetical protein GY754_30835, partial [bacterium]|nr:hypothetical protein [bacterium]
MKKNSISIIFLLFASLFLLISTGCGTSESTSGSDRTGILNLEIVNKHSNSKIILPDIDMTPASYVINGTGPDGATFTVDSSETQVSVIELAFGTWALSVEGYNAAGTRIALGAGTAEVHTGETTNTDITVTPLTGNGTLNFVLTWEAADTETPSIESQLTSSDGTTQDLAFVITNGDTGTCTNDTLPAGYYALSVKLLDNGIYTMGAVEIIRIVEGAVTTGTIDFPEINKPGGTIDINITSDMQEPIDVSLSAVPETIASDAAVDVTASVPDGTGDVFHTWYVNGNFAAAGSTANPSYTITASALKLDGSYRLDVVTFSANGKRAGSKSASFTIAENIIPVVKYSHVFDISAGNPQIGNADIDDMMGTRTLSTYDLSAETQDGKAVWVNPYGARYPGDGLGAIYISHCPVNSKSELTFQLS